MTKMILFYFTLFFVFTSTSVLAKQPVSQRYCEAEAASDLRFFTDFLRFILSISVENQGKTIPVSLLEEFAEKEPYLYIRDEVDSVAISRNGKAHQKLIEYPTDMIITSNAQGFVSEISFISRECIMNKDIAEFESWLKNTQEFYRDTSDLSGDYFSKALVNLGYYAELMKYIIEECNCLRYDELEWVQRLQKGDEDVSLKPGDLYAFQEFATIGASLEIVSDHEMKIRGGAMVSVFNANRGPWMLDIGGLRFSLIGNGFIPISAKTRAEMQKYR